MTILRSKSFVKQYVKLPKSIQDKVDKQLKRLEQDIELPGTRVKKMAGNDNLWEARIDIHFRLTFQVEGNSIFLRKVGRHDVLKNP